jgi:uncharacterized membrane-anchored protein YitT (DUF2179 family)
MINKIRTLSARYIPRFSLRDYLLLTIGALISATNVDLFLAPVNIAPGGVSGAAIILNEFTNWPIGLVMLVLNIPLLALGFRYLGRFRFLVRTAYVVILFSLGIDMLARWLPPDGLTDDLMLNALFGGVVGGIGSGLIYLGQGTSGGTGIVGRVMQRRTGIPLSQVYMVTDGSIVLAAGLAFGWEMALYALIALFVWGVAADQILEGPSVVRTALIVTDQPEDVSRIVIERLKLGITAWPARGMFTASKHTVLFCTVNRPDVNALRSVVLNVDPHAFIVIGHGHQAVGGMVGRNVNPND